MMRLWRHAGAPVLVKRRGPVHLVRIAAAIAVVLLLGFAGPAPPAPAHAANVPSGFSDSVFASGIANPTAMAFAPDGRLFVARQGGQLRVIKNGTLLSTPFLTVSVNSVGERGLLGVAFDPAFPSNQFVYIYYTVPGPTVLNRVSRFTANGDVAVAGSELILLELETLGSQNHNGGAIHFGQDGKLYVAVGDNANGSNAQSLSTRFGKILRINKDGTIPTDNPFYNTASGNNRAIWALGLRNPFTFAVQPGTGRIFINDVGENTWEEINDGIAGSNYGWPNTEGETSNPSYRSPLFAYAHGNGATTGCSIAGGAFYNPATVQFPAAYVGRYFFADYCSGWIRTYDPSTDSAAGFASGYSELVDLKVGADGSLYYLSRAGGGFVGRVQLAAGAEPAITQHPASQTAGVGQSVTFSVSASGAPPLTYQWQRNMANIPGATASSYTFTAAASDDGDSFRVVVGNEQGTITSNAAILTVTDNHAPVGSIVTPTEGSHYNAGMTVNYAGTATDAEDGTLPGSRFTWQVDFHHDTHIHPFIPATTGATSGSFVIPDTGHPETNVWYRITLIVRDSEGSTHTSVRDLHPNLSTIELRTIPPGLQLTLDGQPVSTPLVSPSVVGMKRLVGVISPQASGGSSYTFDSWSDGGAAEHSVTTLASAVVVTATFAESPTQVITFDDRPGQDQPLSGQYPAGVIDWGQGQWYHSGPWGVFGTKSISMTSAATTSAPFTFLSPRLLASIDAYNGGSSDTTVSIRCTGQPEVNRTVAPGQVVVVQTGWTQPCSPVTLGSTNGWDTNFDNLTVACYSLAIAVNPGGAGSVATSPPANCGSSHFLPGSTVTLTAQENDGFDFAGWSGSASGSANPLQLQMTSNTSITATFVGRQGDANGDGAVDLRDAITLQFFLAGLLQAPPLPEYDVNRDGSVTGYDVVAILRIVVGLPAL